jgi:hypothetical protein
MPHGLTDGTSSNLSKHDKEYVGWPKHKKNNPTGYEYLAQNQWASYLSNLN